MKKWVKITIVFVLLLSIAGIWGFKTINVKKTSEISKEKTLDTKGQKNMPVLLEFGAETCNACIKMQPVIDEIRETYKDKVVVKFVNVYDDNNEQIIEKHGISIIPTQVFLDKNEKEIYRHQGYFSKEEIVKVFEKMEVK